MNYALRIMNSINSARKSTAFFSYMQIFFKKRLIFRMPFYQKNSSTFAGEIKIIVPAKDKNFKTKEK